MNEDPVHNLVLRFWRESTGSHAAEKEWRGQITEVESGRVTYVRTVGELAALIRELGVLMKD